MCEFLESVVIEPEREHKYSVIWLHGLGADGYDFYNLVPTMSVVKKAQTRWIFPHAPQAAVTINQGCVMRSWYDIFDTDIGKGSNIEDMQSNSKRIIALLERELQLLKSWHYLHIAGFSQGGVMALNIASLFKLKSVLALSCYHPQSEQLKINKETNIMMMHGTYDQVIACDIGKKTFESLQTSRATIQWQEYPMAHELHPEQVAAINKWFMDVLAG